eukprot:4391731-Amphidinium_carterae.1
MSAARLLRLACFARGRCLSSGPPCAEVDLARRRASWLRTKVSHISVVQYKCGHSAFSNPTLSMKFTGSLRVFLSAFSPCVSMKVQCLS